MGEIIKEEEVEVPCNMQALGGDDSYESTEEAEDDDDDGFDDNEDVIVEKEEVSIPREDAEDLEN